MAKLDPERWRALTPHIDEALDLDPEARTAWLAELRVRDPALAAELETLLREHGALVREGFLEGAAASLPGRFEQRGARPTTRDDAPRYLLGAEHARGGMGRIVRGTDTYLQRPVAIKELLRNDPRAEARFVREAVLTARLEHPSVVPVHDAGRWPGNGKLFYSMKLVSGHPLSERVAEASERPARMGLVWNVLAVAEAMAYAHSQRIIHRDLTPANVLIGDYGETVVVDWGLAKEIGAPDGDAEPLPLLGPVPAATTVAGSVLGTPAFMPPEQAAGAEVDARADVYALGAMLYFVLSGRAPYAGETSRSVLERVLAQPPPRLSERAPETPADLVAIVEKAMARAPADRYPTGKELAADLRRFLEGRLVSARVYSLPEKLARWARRHKTVAALSAIFVAVALAGVVAFGLREQALRREAEASRARADSESLALLVEHGRRELDFGRPSRAAVYLAAAYREAPTSLPLRYLVTEAVRPLAAHAHALKGHTRDVVAVAFRGDGGQVASGSSDRSVRIWDVASGATVRVLEGAESSIEDVAWSPDGSLLASVEDLICVWDPRSGQLLRKLPGAGFRLRFSRDGRYLASGNMWGRLRIYDTRTWQMVVEQMPHRHRIADIAFHPDGTRAATVSWDGSFALWALPGWTITHKSDDHGKPISAAHYSADGQWLLTGDAEGSLHVRSATTGALVQRIRLPKDALYMSAFFTPDARGIVTATTDGVIRMWHASSGSLLYAIDAIPAGKLFDGALSDDGRHVVTAGMNGADLWRLDRVGGHRVLRGRGDVRGGVLPAVHSADGARVVMSLEDQPYRPSRLVIADARTGAQLASWPDLGSGRRIAASADLSTIVTGYDPIPPRLWHGDRLVARLDGGPRRWTRAVAISADGALVATSGDEGPLRLWRGTTGAPLAPIALDGDPQLEGTGTALAFSPDGARLAVGDKGGSLRLYQLPGRRLVYQIKAHTTEIDGVGFSADGRWLVSAGRQDHTARVWAADSGRLRATMTGHSNNLEGAAFSPDASLVATSSGDGTARIWDASTGAELRTIRGPSFHARFSRDGRELFTTGVGDYVVVWDATLDARSPSELAALVARRSPWRLEAGRLVLAD